MKTADRTSRKTKSGTIVSNKMQNTVVVTVKQTMQHPRYGKIVTRSKKFYAHTDSNDLQVGDKVMISETRPLSKLKRWRVVEKLVAE